MGAKVEGEAGRVKDVGRDFGEVWTGRGGSMNIDPGDSVIRGWIWVHSQ